MFYNQFEEKWVARFSDRTQHNGKRSCLVCIVPPIWINIEGKRHNP